MLNIFILIKKIKNYIIILLMDFNVVIIGSGGAACSSAVYLSMSGIKNILMISGNEIGGQISTTSIVENFIGLSGIEGYELGQKMFNHAKKHVPIRQTMVKKIEKHQNKFHIITIDNEKIKCNAVIIATGSNPKTLQLTNENKFFNKGIHTCAICDGFFYKDKIVAVVGGGNSACEQVLYLSKIAKKVYMIHRNQNFKAFPKMLDLIKQTKNVEIITDNNVIHLSGENNLNSITLKNNQEIKVSALFIAIGHIPNSYIIDFIDKNKEGYILVDNYGETSDNMVFACGDVSSTGNLKYKQLIVAAAEGCNTALKLAEYLQKKY